MKTSGEDKYCNHHHKLTDKQMLIDLGTGEFVADIERLRLLGALNGCGLTTRSHCYGHETGRSFVAILMHHDVSIEVREATENHSGREFDGQQELLISWKRTD